ncbi:MAG: hypothetical protein V3W31_04200 [Thermodesulfobacteriota bacterium]
MKAKVLAVAVLFALAVPATAVAAMEGRGMMEGAKSVECRQMVHDMAGMLKETMGILEGISHMPGAAEKERLSEMMGQLDEMLGKHGQTTEGKAMEEKTTEGKTTGGGYLE